MLPIIDPLATTSLVDAVAAVARGGAGWVEYRDKKADDRRAHERAVALVGVCRELDVRLLINDRVDVALAVGADGVHLGQDDLPAAAARELLGDRAIIGISVDTVEEAVAAEALPVDYIAIGPVFGTSSKPDAGPAVGLDGVVDIRLWNIIVDCSELDHLSIYGLGVLVRLHRKMDERLGEIKIASATGLIVTVLRRAHLSERFKIYPDVASARQAFKKVKKTPLIFR